SIAKNLARNNVKIDINDNGEIEVEEALLIGQLRLNNAAETPAEQRIQNTQGLEAFANLTILRMGYNNATSLDVQNMTGLVELSCVNNQLGIITFGYHPNLTTLTCRINSLTEFDTSGLPNLVDLDCSHNSLLNLNISGSPHLKTLKCSGNEMAVLNLSGLAELEALTANDCLSQTVDFSGCVALKTIEMTGNDFLPLVDLT